MQIPHLNKLALQFKDKPIVFLSITPESRAEIDAFLKKRPMESWVGLTKNHRVLDDYGVTGVGRTFLIDAAGKIAADLTLDKLTAEMLDDLLAQKPITVPKTVPFSSKIRESDNSLSRPVFDVMIRPTTEVGRGSGQGRGKDDLMFKAATIRAIVQMVYVARPTRTSGDLPDDKTRYDVWISLPGATPEALREVARQVVSTAFHVRVRKETKDADVYILSAPNGRPAGLVEAEPRGGIFTGRGKGSLSIEGTLSALAGMVESVTGKPVIDETAITGSFKINLKYQEDVPGSLEDAVRALGFKLEPARRPIEFTIVSKTD